MTTWSTVCSSAPHSQAAEGLYPNFATAETSDPGAEAVKQKPRCSWKRPSRKVSAGVGDESRESCNVVQPLRIPLAIQPVVACVLLLSDELMSCCVASTNGCFYLRCREFPLGAQASTEWSPDCGCFATKISRLGAREYRKFAGLCGTQASRHNSQGIAYGRVNEASVSTASPSWSAGVCCCVDQG